MSEPAPRPLGFAAAITLVIGNMVGSGILLLPAALASWGAASLFGWGLSALGAMLLAAVFARLALWMPRTGGPYAFAREGFGDLVGFVIAWSYWISCWCAVAAIAVALAGSLGATFPLLVASPAAAAASAIAALWLVTALNLRGLRTGGAVQVSTTIVKLVPLLVIAVAGLLALPQRGAAWSAAVPVTPIDAALATAALTFWAFQGFECATIPAGAVRDAERTVPRATLAGTAIAVALTVFVCTVVVALVAPGPLAASGSPFGEAARVLWGDGAAALFGLFAALVCFGALNGWVLAQAHIPLAAARDGLFPAAFARTAPDGTPVFGLLAGSALATLLVLANYGGSLVTLFTAAILLSTATALLPYAVCAAAALVIARRRGGEVSASTGFRVLALAGCAFGALALIGTGARALLWGALLVAAGLPFHAWLRRGATSSASNGRSAR